MKKLAIILLPLLILTLALSTIACGGGGEETPKSTPKSTQTQALTSDYDNPVYGIGIAYPQDWTKQEGLMGTVVSFLSPTKREPYIARENVSIRVDDLSTQPMTLNEFTQLAISQIKQTITDYNIIDSGEATLADRPAHEVVFTGKQGQYILKMRVVWAVENNKAYIITYTAIESDYANYQEIVDQMIDSFEIYSPTPTSSPLAMLSEQPDEATFQKYFSDMGFGRMAPDAKSPQDIQRNVTTFTAGDQLTLYGTVIQEVQVSAQYYSVATKQSVDALASPMPLKFGGFASSSNRTLPVGKYECKVYGGDVLVAVFPFEVLATLTTTETPTTKHYTGDTISFDYSGNWVTTSPSSQYAIVTFIDPQAKTVSVTVEKRAIPSGYTLKIFSDALAMGMKPTQMISGSFPTVAGVSACDGVFKINDSQFRMVNLEKDGNMYTILCNAPAATFDNAQTSFNMVINSFKFQ